MAVKVGWRGRGILHTSWIFFKAIVLKSYFPCPKFHRLNQWTLCVLAWHGVTAAQATFTQELKKDSPVYESASALDGDVFSPKKVRNPNTKGVWIPPLTKGEGWFSHRFWTKIRAASSKCLQCFECLIVLDIWMIFWYISRSQDISSKSIQLFFTSIRCMSVWSYWI